MTVISTVIASTAKQSRSRQARYQPITLLLCGVCKRIEGAAKATFGELGKVLPYVATDRAEMHRQPGGCDGIPHLVPPRVRQRRPLAAARDFEPAHAAALGDPLDLADRGVAALTNALEVQ